MTPVKGSLTPKGVMTHGLGTAMLQSCDNIGMEELGVNEPRKSSSGRDAVSIGERAANGWTCSQ